MSLYEDWEWASSNEQFLVIPDVRVPFKEHETLLKRLKWAAQYVPNVRIDEDQPNRMVAVHFKMAEETLKYAKQPKYVLESVVSHVREKLWNWYNGVGQQNDEWVVPWIRG